MRLTYKKFEVIQALNVSNNWTSLNRQVSECTSKVT